MEKADTQKAKDDMPTGQPCLEVFARCVAAIQSHKLIARESRQDKEFHFQNWFKARLAETKLNFEVGGRNTYPDFRVDSRFRAVGKLVRQEAQKLIVGYTFDLRTNTLKPESVDNPAAGTEHKFVAYRLKGSANEAVAMRPPREVIAEVTKAAEEDE